MGNDNVVIDNEAQNIITDDGLDEKNLNIYHSLTAEFSRSREIRDEFKKSFKLKVQAQHELLEQEIGTELDIQKKVIFQRYVDRVEELESQFIVKLDELDGQNDAYEQDVKDKYYVFFDEAREKLKKWKDNPERYKSEMDRIDEQEQKRLKGVQDKLHKIEKKRENIFDNTLKLFSSDYDLEAVKKKFNIF